MRISAQVRAVFAELKRSLDDGYTDRELLRLAHAIILAYNAPNAADVGNVEVPRPSRAFYSQPVDEAMDDGGWQVLDFQSRQGMSFEDGIMTDFEDSFAAECRSLISRLNGIRRLS